MKRMQTEVFGKWILAGEHAVLRGCPALVFPVFSKSLHLSFLESDKPLTIDLGGDHGEELRFLFWSVWEKALELGGKSGTQVTGKFALQNSIPVGAGMGASASICVAVAKWFAWKGWLEGERLYEFARDLENLFHGESSGVDIAVALSGQGLYFERHGIRRALVPTWTPNWYLSYSGQRGITQACVECVKKFISEHPAQAEITDRRMKESVLSAEKALTSPPSQQAFSLLTDAIDQAAQCFDQWGLSQGVVGEHMRSLKNRGAAAVKPTGSGNGGYVLSLWKDEPPKDLLKQFVSLGS